ncbi:hypothetical protein YASMINEVIRUS_659 [Yasminevirus sp. GU-2018]|uniref:Uncharacterized protein n=1 Tax=Yasminevirus sp. GU-2018 TaxID=2420051 RepID=A0A5K0UAS3_9VIRU|nr:hypothetical protein YASMINEVIRUS_659 [Yasminevirus sp. GU-2018]
MYRFFRVSDKAISASNCLVKPSTRSKISSHFHNSAVSLQLPLVFQNSRHMSAMACHIEPFETDNVFDDYSHPVRTPQENRSFFFRGDDYLYCVADPTHTVYPNSVYGKLRPFNQTVQNAQVTQITQIGQISQGGQVSRRYLAVDSRSYLAPKTPSVPKPTFPPSHPPSIPPKPQNHEEDDCPICVKARTPALALSSPPSPPGGGDGGGGDDWGRDKKYLLSILASYSKIHEFLNNAQRRELMKIDSIGRVLSKRIAENRPYSTVISVLDLKMIGPVRLNNILMFALKSVQSEQRSRQGSGQNKKPKTDSNAEPK